MPFLLLLPQTAHDAARLRPRRATRPPHHPLQGHRPGAGGGARAERPPAHGGRPGPAGAVPQTWHEPGTPTRYPYPHPLPDLIFYPIPNPNHIPNSPPP